MFQFILIKNQIKIQMPIINILVVLYDGFEDIEAIVPIDLFKRAKINVTSASLKKNLFVNSRSNLNIKADCHIEDLKNNIYDGIVLPGGPGVFKIIKNKSIKDLIIRHNEKNKIIACICASPILLKEAGLEINYPISCHPSVKSHFEYSSNLKVQCRKNIITSLGAGTSIDFALKIIEVLLDESISKKIALEICC